MILVDGEKYACQQCIRGHRSSTCKHIQRPLVLVRSRGRPLTDSFQRIAIFAEEIKKDEEKKSVILNENDLNDRNLMIAKMVKNNDESCCKNDKLPNHDKEISSCCSKKGNIAPETNITLKQKTVCQCCPGNSPSKNCKKKDSHIFVLKASKRQVYNVQKDSLRLLDPVIEIPNSKVGLDIIQKVSKNNKKMQSCKNKRIREELIKNAGDDSKISGTCCSSSNNIIKRENTNSDDDDNDNDTNDNDNKPLIYQFQLSINKPNKTKFSGESNNGIGDQKISDSGLITSFNLQTPNDKDDITKSNNIIDSADLSRDGVNDAMNTNDIGDNNLFENTNVLGNTPAVGFNKYLYDLYIADSCTVPGSCSCEPDKCMCPDCTEHGEYRNSNLSIKQQFNEFPFPVNISPFENSNKQISNEHHIIPYGQVEMQPSIPLFEQSFLKLFNSQNVDNKKSPSINMDECYCESDKCCCYNCIQHGIINGIRMSDGTAVLEQSTTPYEIQLSSSQYPLYMDSTPSSSSASLQSTPIITSASESGNVLKNSILGSYNDNTRYPEGYNNSLRDFNSSTNSVPSVYDKDSWLQHYQDNKRYTSPYGNSTYTSQSSSQE